MSSATTSKAVQGDSPWALPRPGPASPSEARGRKASPGVAGRSGTARRGGGTAAQVTISPSPSPGQGEQALNRGESPQDRPLKPGAVGHGARKYHGGELRGGPRGYAAEPARGRKGIAPGLTPLEPRGGAVVALRAVSAGGRCQAGRAAAPRSRFPRSGAARTWQRPRRHSRGGRGRERGRGRPGWQRPAGAPRRGHGPPVALCRRQPSGAGSSA